MSAGQIQCVRVAGDTFAITNCATSVVMGLNPCLGASSSEGLQYVFLYCAVCIHQPQLKGGRLPLEMGGEGSVERRGRSLRGGKGRAENGGGFPHGHDEMRFWGLVIMSALKQHDTVFIQYIPYWFIFFIPLRERGRVTH